MSPTRRSFLKALAAIPLLGPAVAAVRQQRSTTPLADFVREYGPISMSSESTFQVHYSKKPRNIRTATEEAHYRQHGREMPKRIHRR